MASCTHGLLLINVLLSVFLFSGIIFGWAPLQTMLLTERDGLGQFSELCGSSPNRTLLALAKAHCEAQLSRLNLVYTLGTFTLSLVSLPGGWFLDKFGVRATVVLSAVVELTGLLLFAFADSKALDVFIPASIMTAAGGFLVMVAAFPTAFLFSRWSTAIFASISCLFDASSLSFAVFEAIASTGLTERKWLFLAYAALAGVIYLSLAVLWTCVTPPGANGGAEQESDTGETEYCQLQQEEEGNEAVVVEQEEGAATIRRENSNSTPLSERPIGDQLRSFEYVFIVAVASLHQLRANTYVILFTLLFRNDCKTEEKAERR